MDLYFPPQDLRTAAQEADRLSAPRRRRRRERPHDVWESVVYGSNSLIEWFDTDTRRFVVIRANPPGSHDPRGLTSQERDVAEHAARGASNKVIAAQLGLSESRVSVLVSSSLRKLDLRSRAQLVFLVRGLGLPVHRIHQARLPALAKSA